MICECEFREPQQWGCFMIIYKATDKENGMIYIGQTINSLSERNRLRKYGSSKFDIEFCRKGEEGFVWEIIDTANNINCLNKKEIYWINYYNSSNSDIGYNLTGGGKNSFLSQESRRKISVSQIGTLNHMYGKKYGKNGASKRIVEINSGIVYESGTQVKDILFNNVNDFDVSSAISKCCKGYKSDVKGYVFRFIDDFGKILYLKEDNIINKNLIMFDGSIEVFKKKEEVYIYNIISEEKITISELSNRNHIGKTNIFASLRRNGISIKQYKLPVLKLREVWLHENDFKFYLDNKEKYDFKKDLSKQSFIFNKYDNMEFRDAKEAEEYYTSKNIRISKKSILDHLKNKSKFKFGVAKNFDLMYVY